MRKVTGKNRISKSKRSWKQPRWKGRKKKVLGIPQVMTQEEYEGEPLDSRVALIQALIPLGLMEVSRVLEEEVTQLAGERYARTDGQPGLARHGTNPGSVRLGGQRHPIRIPRVRNYETQVEVPLESLQALRGKGEVNETLLRRVLYGISCRNYESAGEAVAGAIGLSPSSVSREFIQASKKHLEQLKSRDLSSLDVVVLFLDGKKFAEDQMVAVIGVTLDGRKVPLDFVQTGSENGTVIKEMLEGLEKRGLNFDQGLLVVIDGSKGFQAGVEQALKGRALVQRCQWHKRENVLKYLPLSEQGRWRRRLQQAYEKPTYKEARKALLQLEKELRVRNPSAARSLLEGMEETLTLHRLGVFKELGVSLKTTNIIESIFSQAERRCGKVSHWKNGEQKERWLAATLLDLEPRLRRIKGYKYLKNLREAIQKELKIKRLEKAA